MIPASDQDRLLVVCCMCAHIFTRFLWMHNIHAQAQHSCACTNFCAQLPFWVPEVVPGPWFGARGKARREHVVPKNYGCGQECCAAEGDHLTGDHLRLMSGHGSANYVRTYIRTHSNL
jgi:hypothetical protein